MLQKLNAVGVRSECADKRLRRHVLSDAFCSFWDKLIIFVARLIPWNCSRFVITSRVTNGATNRGDFERPLRTSSLLTRTYKLLHATASWYHAREIECVNYGGKEQEARHRRSAWVVKPHRKARLLLIRRGPLVPPCLNTCSVVYPLFAFACISVQFAVPF